MVKPITTPQETEVHQKYQDFRTSEHPAAGSGGNVLFLPNSRLQQSASDHLTHGSTPSNQSVRRFLRINVSSALSMPPLVRQR